MEHGNTGIPVAPESNKPIITEGEVETVRNIFEKMADTIVGAASLSKEVEALRRQVDQISADLSNARDRNQDLDHILTVTRQDRDELRGQLNKSQAHVAEIEKDLTYSDNKNKDLERRNEAQASTIRQLQDDLANAKKDRDEAIMEGLQKDEKIKELEGFVSNAAKELESILAIFKPKPSGDANVPTSDPTGFGSDRPAFLDKPTPLKGDEQVFSHDTARQFNEPKPVAGHEEPWR